MKITLLLLLTLSLSFGSASAAHAQAINDSNGFDEYLTFDDNQIPPGWAIIYPGGTAGNAGIANQRFQIGQVDTYATLAKDKTLPLGANEVHISFRCPVRDIYWGMGCQVHLLMQDGSDFMVSLGKAGYGDEQINVYAGKVGSLTLNQLYAPDYGDYLLDTSFQDGRMKVTARKKGSNMPLVSQTIDVPGLTIAQLKTVWLFGWMTAGSPAWIDDAKILALEHDSANQ